MSEIRKLKLNAPLRGISAGMVVNVRTNKKGIPLDIYWRNRLEDAKTDGCVEIVKETRAVKETVETKKRGE